jgi:hypothetical protein
MFSNINDVIAILDQIRIKKVSMDEETDEYYEQREALVRNIAHILEQSFEIEDVESSVIKCRSKGQWENRIAVASVRLADFMEHLSGYKTAITSDGMEMIKDDSNRNDGSNTESDSGSEPVSGGSVGFNVNRFVGHLLRQEW